MFRLPALVLCAVCLAPSIARAAVYYVAPFGSDGGTGTEAMPWRTIQKCAATMVAGDTCIVGDGTYPEKVTISRSGSPGSVITFQSATTYGAIVNGQFDVSGNYVVIQNFKIMLPDGAQFGVRLTGNYAHAISNHISTDSTALGMNPAAITTYPAVTGTHLQLISNRIDSVCFGIVAYGSAHLIESNDISALKMNASCGDLDYIRFFGRNHIIRNNKMYGTDLAVLDPSIHTDCLQTFDSVSSYAITDVLIEGNFCSDAFEGMMIGDDTYVNTRLTVRNNVFTNVRSWCVCLYGVTNAMFYNNTCDTTGGIHGMWCRDGASCEFKNNIIYGEGSLYGVMGSGTLIDGDASAPGKNNLLFQPGKTITGFANDVKNRDPLFASRGLGNYHIGSDSPARNAALTISSWTIPTDKDGVPRPQGAAWDIGAFEFRLPAAPTGVRIIR